MSISQKFNFDESAIWRAMPFEIQYNREANHLTILSFAGDVLQQGYTFLTKQFVECFLRGRLTRADLYFEGRYLFDQRQGRSFFDEEYGFLRDDLCKNLKLLSSIALHDTEEQLLTSLRRGCTSKRDRILFKNHEDLIHINNFMTTGEPPAEPTTVSLTDLQSGIELWAGKLSLKHLANILAGGDNLALFSEAGLTIKLSDDRESVTYKFDDHLKAEYKKLVGHEAPAAPFWES